MFFVFSAAATCAGRAGRSIGGARGCWNGAVCGPGTAHPTRFHKDAFSLETAEIIPFTNARSLDRGMLRLLVAPVLDPRRLHGNIRWQDTMAACTHLFTSAHRLSSFHPTCFSCARNWNLSDISSLPGSPTTKLSSPAFSVYPT